MGKIVELAERAWNGDHGTHLTVEVAALGHRIEVRAEHERS